MGKRSIVLLLLGVLAVVGARFGSSLVSHHSAHAGCETHKLVFFFARSRSSTTGGTSPLIVPFSVNTSLISRELM